MESWIQYLVGLKSSKKKSCLHRRSGARFSKNAELWKTKNTVLIDTRWRAESYTWLVPTRRNKEVAPVGDRGLAFLKTPNQKKQIPKFYQKLGGEKNPKNCPPEEKILSDSSALNRDRHFPVVVRSGRFFFWSITLRN